MNEPLDESYFRWLCSQVTNIKLKNPSRTHWSLLKILHSKEFVWIIPNDDNRLEDGRDLRSEFLVETRLEDVDPAWMSLGCSMLEMLIALAHRLSFEDDRELDLWFWEMLDNLGLSSFSDRGGWDAQDVDDILSTVIWRTYEPDGRGGLFPLADPHDDQTQVELWYQQSSYILENGG